MDLLELYPDGSARITDFKTGPIRTDNGKPKPEWLIQIRAYGYLVIDQGITRSPRLRLIGTDGFWERDFIERDRREVQRELDSIVDRVPRDHALQARELACFGPACRYCDHRPVCGTYRDAAPTVWREGTTFPLPTDTWGRVVEVRPEPGGTLRVRLEDAAERSVSILGVPERLAGDLGRGDRIWFFSLRGIRREKTDHHFRNFRIKAARAEHSAHGALVMVGDVDQVEK